MPLWAQLAARSLVAQRCAPCRRERRPARRDGREQSALTWRSRGVTSELQCHSGRQGCAVNWGASCFELLPLVVALPEDLRQASWRACQPLAAATLLLFDLPPRCLPCAWRKAAALMMTPRPHHFLLPLHLLQLSSVPWRVCHSQQWQQELREFMRSDLLRPCTRKRGDASGRAASLTLVESKGTCLVCPLCSELTSDQLKNKLQGHHMSVAGSSLGRAWWSRRELCQAPRSVGPKRKSNFSWAESRKL